MRLAVLAALLVSCVSASSGRDTAGTEVPREKPKAEEREQTEATDPLSCENISSRWQTLTAKEEFRSCSADSDCVLLSGAETCDPTRALDLAGAPVASTHAATFEGLLRFWEQHCRAAWPQVADAKRADALRCERGLCVANRDESCGSPSSD